MRIEEVEDIGDLGEHWLWIPKDRMKRSQESQYAWYRSSIDYMRLNNKNQI